MADVEKVLTSQVTVSSTTASQLNTGQPNASSGVLVKALSANSTTNVYIGGASTVSATSGFELAAGASQLFPVTGVDELWVISAAGSPKVCYMIL
jgi:hypothetical protein